MKKRLLLLTLLSLLAVVVTACVDINSSSSSGGATTSNPTVHMNETKFVPDTITLKKGEKLTVVDDVAVFHVIQNGEWDQNGSQRPGAEAGAPPVQQQFSGNDTHTIGPFNTAGTFHFYCPVHQDMNLTVTVQ